MYTCHFRTNEYSCYIFFLYLFILFQKILSDIDLYSFLKMIAFQGETLLTFYTFIFGKFSIMVFYKYSLNHAFSKVNTLRK